MLFLLPLAGIGVMVSRLGAVLLFAVFTLLLAGCGGANPPAPGPQGLYEVHCAKCHARAGEPGGPGIGGSRGPNLSKIGAARGRDAAYFARFIRDPRAVDPEAKLMPAFADTLTDEEIRSLAEFLAAKK
jgi:mono/diheme cytochrome c family protein